jgi:magnesium transporter
MSTDSVPDPPPVRTRLWRNGVLEKENFPLADVSDYICQPDCLVWADVCQPDARVLAQLAEELSLDPHAVEDATAMHERPKASRYATHLFLTTNAIRHDPDTGELVVGRVSAFSVRHCFVTVRLDDHLDIDAVVRRWDENADLLRFGSRALAYGLLDEIVDGYFIAIESLDDEVEQIEDVLFDDNLKGATAVQRRTFTLRRSLVTARRSVLPMREVVNTMMRHVADDEHFVDMTPYFEDLYDHVLRAAEWSDSLRDMITSIFETNMALSDTRMNLVMKKLTAWAAIIAVPTAITGWFGQNIPYPGFGDHFGLVLSTVSIVLIAAVLYVMFRRKDWL